MVGEQQRLFKTKKIIMKKECECTDECLGYLTKECKRIEEPKQHVEFINENIEQFDKAIKSFKQETLKEVAERIYSDKMYPMYGGIRRDAFTKGYLLAKEEVCNSEIIQRIRATKSDAEARRIIKSI